MVMVISLTKTEKKKNLKVCNFCNVSLFDKDSAVKHFHEAKNILKKAGGR